MDRPTVSISHAPQDPLVQTIRAYRAGVAAITAMPIDDITQENEDSLVEATYGPHMEALTQWDRPAASLEGAIDALKLARDESLVTGDIGNAMIASALAYLDRDMLTSKPDSPVVAAYKQWCAIHQSAKVGKFSEDEMAELCRRMDEYADTLLALPSSDPLDFIVKIVVATDEMEVPVRYEWNDAIREEALAFLKMRGAQA